MENYVLLNSSITDSIEQIKKNYNKLARIYHPDKSNTDGQKFKEINDAYNWIKQNHNTPNPTNFNPFESQGYSTIPSMHQYVSTELLKMNSTKIENKSNSLVNFIKSFL